MVVFDTLAVVKAGVQAIDPRADWALLLEAIHGEARDDAAWADHVVDGGWSVFPKASKIGVYSARYDARGAVVDLPIVTKPDLAEMVRMMNATTPRIWSAFHFGAPVGTHLERAQALERETAQTLAAIRSDRDVGDAVGIVAHPEPGLVTVFSAAFDAPVALAPHQRRLLRRIALHLESGHRVRANEQAVVAEIDAKGRVSSPLREEVAHIDEARSRRVRRTPEATELWAALAQGRMSIVPRGKRYLVLDNPPSSHHLHALTRTEIAVLDCAARGMSSREIRYALGISNVSATLHAAAAKVGVLQRNELVRLAALLTRNPKELLDDRTLSTAEREILDLLERGLDNREIATARMRSVRTIANQVASLLRKTSTNSRRQLVARAARR